MQRLERELSPDRTRGILDAQFDEEGNPLPKKADKEPV